MIQFLHLSDLHISRVSQKNECLYQIFFRIQWEFPKHYILITGDLTDDGHRLQYAEAVKLLQPFRGRLILCPGNHDYGLFGNLYEESCVSRYWTCERTLQGKRSLWRKGLRQHVLTDPDTSEKVRVITLDSNLRTRSPFDFACGEIGSFQRLWLRLLLSQPKRIPTIVCLHHHPFYHRSYYKLLDDEAFMKVLRNKVDVLCFGHKHQFYLWRWISGIPEVSAAGSLRESGQVAEITIKEGEITVQEGKL